MKARRLLSAARRFLSAVTLGLGLTLVLLSILMHYAPLTRASPSTYYVRTQGTGNCFSVTTPCGSLQQAINLASTAGDEVHVAGGVYTEGLTITRSVTLRGGWDISFTLQNPISTPTVLDHGFLTHNLHISGTPLAEITVEGMTLHGGNTGILVSGGQITIERCGVRNVDGRGLKIDGGTVVVSATQITTAQRGVEVAGGLVRILDAHISHIDEVGLLVKGSGIVTFTGGIIEACNQPGVQVEGGHLWLFNNLIHHTHADGVQVKGGRASIISNTIHSTLANGLDLSGTHVISGNLVYAVAECGITVQADDGALRVVDNVVHDAPQDAVRIDSGLTAAIWGNTIYNVGDDGLDVRGDAITITHNRVSDCQDNGIQAEGSTTTHIEANLVLSNGVGIAIRGTDGLTETPRPTFALINNIVGDHVTASVELAGTGKGVILHNTLVGDGSAHGLDSGSGWRGVGLRASGSVSVTLINNMIVSHSVGITATTGTTLNTSHTLLWGNTDDPISGTVVLIAPPLFSAPTRQNYHLRIGSPAVDGGGDTGVHVDIDGDPRPTGPQADIGADELRVYLSHLPVIVRFDPPLPPPVPLYRLYADPADLNRLAQKPRQNETIPATFCVSSQESEASERCWDVDVRYRGDTARLMDKKSWKVFFSASDPFQGPEGLVYELNLNADYVDQSLLRSYLGYDLFARAGVPSPRAGYARLFINDDYYGLFSQVEQVDERFLYRTGMEIHGNLYKPFYGFLGIESSDWWYDYHYPKKTNRESGIKDMVAFIELINYTPDEQFPRTMAKVLDVNGWLDWYAVNILIGNLEMMGKNYYLYHDLSAERWAILPWDVDISFGHNEGKEYGLFDRDISWDNPIDSGADPAGEHNYLIEHMTNVPEFRLYHCRTLVELMADEFSPAEMFPRIDETFTTIYDAAMADPNRWRPDLEGYPGFEDGPDEIKTYIVNRIEFLREKMPGFCPDLEVPLTINEFMAQNATAVADKAGDYDEWVEIYNASTTLAWDLGGMYLTDVLTQPKKWRFPDDARIPPGGTLLVWTDGEEDEGPLHANFTLAVDGGQIGLFDDDAFSNTAISTLTYTAQMTDVSYGRLPDGSDGDDSWRAFAIPTPGWPNQGRPPNISNTTRTPSQPSASDAVVVTTIITDDITDEQAIVATVWLRTFSPGAQPPGYQPIPMTASGNRYSGVIPAQPEGTWVEYYVEAEDEAGMVSTDRPGWPQGDYRYVVGWQRPSVYISELMAVNAHTIEDETGEYDDWIELYNAGPVDVDVGGMYLSNSIGNATQFVIPPTTTIPGRGYLVLWADGEDTGVHLNFGLSGAGEYVGLFDSQENHYAPVDAVYYDPQMPDVSWGRFPAPVTDADGGPDGGSEWYAMVHSTPGEANRLHPPEFSQTMRTPLWPNAGQSVSVTVVITAGYPIVSATLWHDVGDGFQVLSMTPVTEGGPGSSTTWQSILPSLPEDTLVQYYLEAVDSLGQRTRHPAGAPGATYRYLVGYTPPPVLINEFLADNESVNQDPAGEYDDWVELYNHGAVTVTLDGMYLSDDLAAPRKWRFPGETTILPGGHLLVWCDKDIGQGPLHADFGLSRHGEALGLFDSTAHGNVPLDTIVFGPQHGNISYGRQPDGSNSWRFFDPPTPEASNG
jgi:spore coat protein CotH